MKINNNKIINSIYTIILYYIQNKIEYNKK